MKRLFLLAGLAFLLGACSTTPNPITGRNQLLLMSPEEGAALGLEAMNEVKKTAKVVTAGPQARRVAALGAKLAAVSHKPELDWEFIVIDEDVLNAWALPGGKIAVYTKMLEAFPSDNELSAIMGHEIAHAVLRHSAENASRQQVQQITVAGVAVAAGAATGDDEIANTALIAGSALASTFVQLPHSRFMELEADDIGAVYMARAGYDPRGAVRVWQEMKRLSQGGSTPTFLSTHPNDDQRIKRLESKMPEYVEIYEQSRKR